VAAISDLPLRFRIFLRAYPWRRIDPVPLARRRKPVEESRVALVTTAGLVPPRAPPFDPSVKGGDFSYRIIAGDADVAHLEEHHRSESFDHAGIALDRLAAPSSPPRPECCAHRGARTMTADRITLNPAVLQGKPVVRGTRIPVEDILRKLSEGACEADLLDAYPRLTREDIRAVLRASSRALWNLMNEPAGGKSLRRWSLDAGCTAVTATSQYDVMSFTVGQDDVAQFQAVRMSDGRKVLAKVDAAGAITILDDGVVSDVVTLERIR
jgi:uncharacterized protein (DUF433 family)